MRALATRTVAGRFQCVPTPSSGSQHSSAPIVRSSFCEGQSLEPRPLPLFGEDRKWPAHGQNDTFDPQETSANPLLADQGEVRPLGQDHSGAATKRIE